MSVASWCSKGVGLALVAACLAAAPVLAQTVSSDAIVEKLRPKPLTRSLTRTLTPPPQESAEDKDFIRGLSTTRGLRQEERAKVVEIVEKAQLPKIDIEINFDYDSDKIRDSSKQTTNALGQALLNPQLANGKFLVNGHTDAAGSAEYNQALSERRAQAIKAYLSSTFGIAPDRLIVGGFGKERLKNPADPLGEVNRRVEVVNLSQG